MSTTDPNPDKDEIDEDEIDEDEDRQEKRAYDEITAWKNMRRLGFIVTEIVEHPGMLYVAEPARRSWK